MEAIRQFFIFDPRSVKGSSQYDDESITYDRPQIELFGQRVDWRNGRHYHESDLEPYRYVGDPQLDRILDLVTNEKEENGNVDVGGRFYDTIAHCAGIYSQLKDMTGDEIKKKDMSERDLSMFYFYKHYFENVPDWVDWTQLQRGMDVFVQHSIVAGLSLYYLALVPGFSIPKIAEVLKQTGYLTPPSSVKQVQARLFDTGGFLAASMLASFDSDDSDAGTDKSEGDFPAYSLQPGNEAFRLALNVRLLHAKVRRSILKRKKPLWNTESYGIPINQEDLGATLLAFSVNVLMGVEFIAGTQLTDSEQLDYIALWRYIGWLLGIETHEGNFIRNDPSTKIQQHTLPPLDPCGVIDETDSNADNAIVHARAMLESIIIHLMRPDESSREIARHLLNPREKQNTGKLDSETDFMYLYKGIMCRRFIGNQLADELALPALCKSWKSFFAYTCTTLVLLSLRVYTLLIIRSKVFSRVTFRWHNNILQKFLTVWRINHSKRMDDAHKNANKSFKRNVSKSNITRPPICPFGLVVPVKSSNHHLKVS
mmetsp:Transcript_8022/g.10263  ORF Transcript_8022/g.10263 Transcript_8022/m.10263 type:complete len:540 (-) Transcript_8022:419-2038(-)